jgi:pilus assembly protein CpaD
MTSNLTRKLALLTLAPAALWLSACTTSAGGKGPVPITPTERYALKTIDTPEQMAFAPHAEGLSDGQRSALDRYAQGWQENGGGDISISAPADGGDAASRVAWAARARLQQLGVSPEAVKMSSYKAEKVGAPVLIVYDRAQAVIPRCGESWTNLGATRKNDTQANFGCATTANFAAQIANPHDIRSPRTMDPADAGRRTVVMDKYRKGEPTAAKSDSTDGGKVATAVQN